MNVILSPARIHPHCGIMDRGRVVVVPEQVDVLCRHPHAETVKATVELTTFAMIPSIGPVVVLPGVKVAMFTQSQLQVNVNL